MELPKVTVAVELLQIMVKLEVVEELMQRLAIKEVVITEVMAAEAL
jgi:hypothetical protein